MSKSPRPSFVARTWGDVGVAPLRAIPIALRQCGVDPAPVLASVGLSAAAFDDERQRVAFPVLGRLFEACTAKTGLPHFALLAASHFELPMLGTVGYLMRNEATAGTAVRSLVLYTHLHDRGAVPALLRLTARRSALSYAIYARDTPMRGMIDDAAMMIVQRMFHTLCGPRWRPLEVRLAHAAPRDPRPYREAFDAPVRFDATLSTVVFESRWLDEPVAGADPQLRRLLADRVEAMERQSPGDLTGKVRRILRTGVLGGTANAAQVAGMLAMSERTLRRRLRSEGASLIRLIAEARLLAAQQLIEETRLPLADIALALKYSDASALSRAFRGWTGIAPSQWRSQSPSRAAADASGPTVSARPLRPRVA
jgi:AraC-like DNA-binding protein